VYVCKRAFVQLHQITNSKVDHILQQITAGKSAPSPDHRGKHSNRPHRVDPNKVDDVKHHIRQFPAETYGMVWYGRDVRHTIHATKIPTDNICLHGSTSV